MTYTLAEQKKHRADLVAALRSGKYAQITGSLHTTEGYCCLGVACEISGTEWGEDTYKKGYYAADHGSSARMGLKQKDYFGFISLSGSFDNGQSSLMDLNDEKRYTFEQIADVIESEPIGLFENADE